MSKENSSGLEHSPANVGALILAAMTEQEVALILDLLLAYFTPSELKIALDRLPNNTRQTLEQILDPTPAVVSIEKPVAIKPEKPMSVAKLEQIWAGLWKEWNDIVSEATDEDGKYIEQEEEWEPPYFNDSALIEDLEAVAEQIQPLLADAFEYGFIPNIDFEQVFIDMEEEIADTISDEILNEGFHLDKHLTTCLLEWARLKAQAEEIDAFGLIEKIRNWEEKSSQTSLHEFTFLDFFTQLSDVDLQQIYAGLTANRKALLWQTYLDDIKSHWHSLYLYCLERFDSNLYLVTLRDTIPQQWQNGLPVIEDLLAKGEDRESRTAIEETLASLLKSTRRDPQWSPENSLLMIGGTLYNRSGTDDELTLLRYDRETAVRLHQSARVAALDIQLIAYEHRFDWSVMLAAFKQGEIATETNRKLFDSWCNYIVSTTERVGTRQPASSWWLNWLLESLMDAPQGSGSFQYRIEQWLTELEQDKDRSAYKLQILRLLTHDLGQIYSENWSKYPKFLGTVLAPRSLETADAKSRQSFLQQSVTIDIWTEMMTYWQNHLDSWIPQPELARKPVYTEHATWVAALREISPTAYDRLLTQWRVKYKQRRNLWQALGSMGLS